MFHTLTNVQSVEACPLQHPIDNRGGALHVGLRSIHLWVGWYNIEAGEVFEWRKDRPDSPDIPPTELEPGLYNFEQLRDVLLSSGPEMQLEIAKTNGAVTVVIPEGFEARLSPGLRTLLGLDDQGWLDAGTYVGDRPVNFAVHPMLYVHLDQVSTVHNMADGEPSTLIGVVPITDCKGFGMSSGTTFPHPEFHKLQDGMIAELKVRITDAKNRCLDNHGLPITVTLEVK